MFLFSVRAHVPVRKPGSVAYSSADNSSRSSAFIAGG
jgi:hypothetical protein